MNTPHSSDLFTSSPLFLFVLILNSEPVHGRQALPRSHTHSLSLSFHQLFLQFDYFEWCYYEHPQANLCVGIFLYFSMASTSSVVGAHDNSILFEELTRFPIYCAILHTYQQYVRILISSHLASNYYCLS